MGQLIVQFFYAVLGIAILIAPLWASISARAEVLPGPIPAHVTQIVDGDTVWVRAHIWLGQDVTTKVRLADIDTPERGGRAKCGEERQQAEAARTRLASLIGDKDVTLFDVEPDKYAGRVIARLERSDGLDPGKVLIAEGLAVAYDPRTDWCLID